MVQTGDEVLDYQQAVNKYQGCDLIIEKGGDHSFIDYDKKLPQIMRFLSEWSRDKLTNTVDCSKLSRYKVSVQYEYIG